MAECKYCKELELEWFFEENTSKYKLGRKIDDNVYIPHNCPKFNKKEKKGYLKEYPWRYVGVMCINICKKHEIELTELMRCKKCSLDKICNHIIMEQKSLKYPYRFKIVDGKEIKDYDITTQNIIDYSLSLN